MAAQSQAATSPQQLQPVPLPHLYWHFLIHQSQLDAAAAKLDSQGKNGALLRNDLQTRLGFSDADYAPIRTSSQRLASEMAALSQQLKALQPASSNAAQINALAAQREAYINNEVYNLSMELSPQNKVALERFMTQFFAPKQLSVKIPASAGQTAAQGVAK